MKRHERGLATLAAKRYYLEHVPKNKIAEELGISRFKAARLLQAAIEEGIVEIQINGESLVSEDLERQLIKRFNLAHARVVHTPAEPTEQQRRVALGAGAARLLSEIVTPQDVLGVGWGRSVKAVAEALADLPACTVVQLGGMAGSVDENSSELVRVVAAVTGGKAYPLYAPLVVPDRETARRFKAQPEVRRAFEQFPHVTKAVVSVGSWAPANSQFRAAFRSQEQNRLRLAGARGEVCGVLFDDNGRSIAHSAMERCIAIGAEELSAIPSVIGVAGGDSKVLAIKAALLGRYMTSLVTDVATARQLLSAPDP